MDAIRTAASLMGYLRLMLFHRHLILSAVALGILGPGLMPTPLFGALQDGANLPLLQTDEAAARSLIDREAESPEMDADFAASRLEAAAIARPHDDGLWKDLGDVLAERSLELLLEGRVREAWERVERGKCLLFERWSKTELEPVPLEDLQLWLGGADASLLVYSESQTQPLIAFLIDAHEIHAYELGEEWRGTARGAEAGAQQVADSWFNAELAEQVSSAVRLFVVPRQGDESVPVTAAIDLICSNEGDPLEQALGQGPPVSFLPAASFLRGRISPRMRAGSGFTLFAEDAAVAEIARRKDRVWLGEEARWSQFEDKDTRDSDVIHFDLPLDVSPRGENVTLGTSPPPTPVESIAVQLAADWISAFRVTAPGHASRRNFVFRFLHHRSRSFAMNMTPLPEKTAEAARDILFAQLRSGLARDEAIRATRLELFAQGHSLEDCYALELWGAGNLPVYALVPPKGIGGLIFAWVFFLVSGFWIVSFLGRRLSPSDHDPS